ncbi:MAG TPA: proton-conducting transporter membrane subunit [Solirubrobacter sp.]|nr:proton-conducting transporter membrane subunit [Solirubrobacter sp.]
MGWALIVVLAVPLIATAIAVADGWRLARASAFAAALIALGLSVALALRVRDGAAVTALHGWLRLDSLGAVFLVATAFLYAAASAFSIGYLGVAAGEARFAPFARRYCALLNLFAWTMLLVPLASDFGILWVAVELTTIISALLVAIDRTDAALEASWKYVLIASSGLGIALLAIIVLYAAGTPALGEAYVPRFERVFAAGDALHPDAVHLAFVLAVVGFGTKVGFVPLHTWLPDAHSEAPAPASAMLSGSLLAAALYAVLRFYQVAVVAGQRTFAGHVLVVFGALSLVVASLFVLRQRSFKRLLAYSSIEHMGVIALGIGFGAPLAVAGALLHVLTHASAKGLAFFGAGSVLRRYDTKDVDGVTGAATVLPWSGPLFLAAALALCGLPVSGVFRSEFQIVAGGFAQPQYVGLAILIVFVNVAFFGVLWHVGRMVLTPAAPDQPRGELSVWMVAAMVACLIVVVALGAHVPSELGALLGNAAERLEAP